MKNLRRSGGAREASEGLARLALNKRAVTLIGDGEKSSESGALPARGRGSNLVQSRGASKGKVATKAGKSVVAATAAAATSVQRSDDEDATDVAAAPTVNTATKAGRQTATTVRRGGQQAGRVVRGGITANQKRLAAAKAAKSAAARTGAGTTASRGAQISARAAATVANWVRVIAAAVSSVTASTPVVAIIAAVMAVVLAVVTIIGFLIPASASAACNPGMPGRVDPANIPDAMIAGYGTEQLVNAAYIITAGQDQGLTLRDVTVGVMTSMGESGLRVLDYGDVAGPDSRGLFQQRDNWGSLADRMDPYKSATFFFTAMQAKVSEQDRATLAPTLIAHKIQVNADPNHYERFWEPATAVVSALSGIKSGLNNSPFLCPTGPLIPGQLGKDGWAKPADGPITSEFGLREIIHTPVGDTPVDHVGLDFAAGGCGGPIWAIKDGTVINVSQDRAGAWMIDVDHGGGVVSRYKHMFADGVLVKTNDTVKAGQQIGKTGSTGFASGCHLHLELHVNGVPIDPKPVLTAAGITY